MCPGERLLNLKSDSPRATDPLTRAFLPRVARPWTYILASPRRAMKGPEKAACALGAIGIKKKKKKKKTRRGGVFASRRALRQLNRFFSSFRSLVFPPLLPSRLLSSRLSPVPIALPLFLSVSPSPCSHVRSLSLSQSPSICLRLTDFFCDILATRCRCHLLPFFFSSRDQILLLKPPFPPSSLLFSPLLPPRACRHLQAQSDVPTRTRF